MVAELVECVYDVCIRVVVDVRMSTLAESFAQDKIIPRQLCACRLRMTVASNGAGTCSPTSKLTTQSARGSESGIVRSNQLTKPSVYSSTFPAPSYAVQSRSGSSLRSRCPYWPKSLNVVLRAKPTLAHSSTPSCAFPRTAGKTPSARRSITGLSLTLAPHQQARGSTRGTGEACTTRATHNARSQLALSRFSSGRPTPAPRCKGISLHRTAPCTEVQADFPASAPPVRVACTEFWHLASVQDGCEVHVQASFGLL